MTDQQKRTASSLRDQLTVMGQRDIPTNRDGFDDEFDSLRHLDHRTRQNRDEFYTAILGSNMSKNRYADVLPNEPTRVVLDPINVMGDGDYINANYVDGRRLFGVPFVYIATQAPLRSTVGDFWRMVYENNTAFIVMLCADIEAGKQKSEKYWPEGQGGVMQLGPLSLVSLSENHRADTIFRTILIRTVDGKERKVFHLQYMRWPDQGIPESSAPLMEIIMALGRSPLSTQTPTVVHCSGGVGRTGVFIAMHVALALFQLEKPVSVPHIVQYLKLCRSGMVQRKDQYLFTYYAILREMERMVWSFDQTAHVDAMISSSTHNNARQVTVPKARPSEHVPMHVAQFVGDIPRSSLGSLQQQQQQQSRSGNRRGQSQPEHGIRVTRHVPTRQTQPFDDDFGPSYESAAYDTEQREMPDFNGGGGGGSGGAAGGGGGNPNSVEEQLRQLQMRTKSIRNTNSAGASRYFGGAAARNGTAAPSNNGVFAGTNYQQQQQPPSSRATPPLQPQKLSLEDPRGQTPPPLPVLPSGGGGGPVQSLPPLSVLPQLKLSGGGGASAPPAAEHRPIVASSRSAEPTPNADPAAAPRNGSAAVYRGEENLFFSPEPSKPSAQFRDDQQQPVYSIPLSSLQLERGGGDDGAQQPNRGGGGGGGYARQAGGVSAQQDTLAGRSDLYAASRDFNSALFASVGGSTQQQFTTSGRASAARKADIGLL